MYYLILGLTGVGATCLYGFINKRKPRPKIGCGSLFGNCYGEMGGGVSGKTQYEKNSTEQQNVYTPEQKAYMKNMLDQSTPTTNTLMNAINQNLNMGLTGTPTAAETAQTLQEKQGVANSYKNAATQSTEALAGRGTLDSGVANRVMANLQGNQAVANQTADTNSLARQQDAFLKAIQAALGITSLASGLSTAEQGKDLQSSTHGTGWGGNFNSSVDMGSIMSMMCWVAREIFGSWEHPKTISARFYIKNYAPEWFRNFYQKHGPSIAKFIHNKPILKIMLRPLFEYFAFRGQAMVEVII